MLQLLEIDVVSQASNPAPSLFLRSNSKLAAVT